MSKYFGPRLNILKNLYLVNLQSFCTKKSSDLSKKNVKKSNFFLNLKKKRFIKYYYNIREKQLNKYKKYIDSKIGFKNLELLLILEKRIDSILFQHYITKSISESRKYILEKKIFINSYCVYKPSFIVSIGDVIVCFKNNNNIYYNFFLKKNYSLIPKAIILKKNYIKLLILRHTQPFEIPLKLNN